MKAKSIENRSVLPGRSGAGGASGNCAGHGAAVTLIDTTLRDGAQAVDVVLSHESRVRIAAELYGCGITEIEAGMPAMGPEEQRTIQSIARELPGARIIGWCRAHESDLACAAKCGCDTIHISFPVSDIHLRCLGLKEEWVEKNLPTLVQKARNLAGRVAVGFLDASRTPIARLAKFASMAAQCGVHRIRIADTVGILTPLSCARLIKSLVSRLPGIEFEFHGHNDLGMASANTVTALQSGAKAASVTVNGIGERSGNAALEEVAAALMAVGTPKAPGLRMERIVALCNLLSRIRNEPIPAIKPVTGKNAFRHEAGMHSRAILRDVRAYEPFSPRQIGRLPSAIVAGTHSGSSGVQSMLAASGVSIDRNIAAKLQPRIRETAYKTGRSLGQEEVLAIYKKEFGWKRKDESKDAW
jgi:homocitrate synthase NifV